MGFSKGIGYKASWYRQVAERRGMTLLELIREIKGQHSHIKYLAFPVECRAADKAWRKANPERTKTYDRRWKEDKEGELARHREWLYRNPHKAKEYNRRARSKNPEALKKKKREEYLRNADKYIARSVRWSKENPDKKAAYHQKRRAFKTGNGSADCIARIVELRQETQCHWCNVELNDKNRTIDHVIPLIRGGTHTPDNLVAACRSCNCSKNKKLVSEWRPELLKEAA